MKEKKSSEKRMNKMKFDSRSWNPWESLQKVSSDGFPIRPIFRQQFDISVLFSRPWPEIQFITARLRLPNLSPQEMRQKPSVLVKLTRHKELVKNADLEKGKEEVALSMKEVENFVFLVFSIC